METLDRCGICFDEMNFVESPDVCPQCIEALNRRFPDKPPRAFPGMLWAADRARKAERKRQKAVKTTKRGGKRSR